MNTIHTNGPWTAEKHPKGHYGIFQLDHPYQIAEVLERNTSPEMVEANAHIIAAAPEMFAALEGILADDDSSVSLADQRSRWASRMDAGRAALEKAYGQNVKDVATDPAPTKPDKI